jgi:hypothetical protein
LRAGCIEPRLPCSPAASAGVLEDRRCGKSGGRPAACWLANGRGEGVPGGCGIPEHAKLLLTLPDGQPGNTGLARKRRTTSHLAGHWPAGTSAGAVGGQAGRGGAGVVR